MAKNQVSSAPLGDHCASAVNSSSFPDLLGRRTGATAKNKLGTLLSSETYQYDLRSQLTGYTGPTGTIGYGYDLTGNLAGAKSSTPGGYDVSYDYDTQNRITMVHRGQQGIDPTATQLAAYNYDANGNLNGTGYANGIQHAYTYNPQNRLTALNVSSISSSPISNPQSLQGYAYTLNKNGHRTQITELSGRTINNTFDKLHRLTREAITGSAPVSGASTGILPGVLSYSYDLVGNRTTRTTTGPVATIIPNQTQSFTVNDRLTTDTYDSNGNTTSSLITDHGSLGTNASDVYSFDNRLIRRTTPDGKVIDLTYNPDGHRLSKFITQNALTQRLVHYLTDTNNPTGYAQVIEEKEPLDIASPLRKVNLYGHDLISSESRSVGVSPTSSIFYNYDGLGSVRSISNSTGDLTETYDYDAYGTLIGLNKRNPTTGVRESTDLTNPANKPVSEFLYTGEQWDEDLGMYFLRARYLNTNTGRFHTQDTYEGRNGEPLTLHKYLYANGNPAMFTDPSGQFVPLWLMGIFVHQKIADDFISQDRDHRTANRQLRTIISYFTGEYPDGAEGRLSKGNVFLTLPDLIDYRTKEIYEIKPAHLAPQGAIQLAGYVGILNLFGGAGFTFGTSYKPPSSVDLPFGYKAMIIPASVAGLVLYELYNPILTKVTLGTVAAAATVYVGYNTALAFSGFAEEFATASFLGSRGIL